MPASALLHATLVITSTRFAATLLAVAVNAVTLQQLLLLCRCCCDLLLIQIDLDHWSIRNIAKRASAWDRQTMEQKRREQREREKAAAAASAAAEPAGEEGAEGNGGTTAAAAAA